MCQSVLRSTCDTISSHERDKRGDLVVVLVSGLIFYECCKVHLQRIGGGGEGRKVLGSH